MVVQRYINIFAMCRVYRVGSENEMASLFCISVDTSSATRKNLILGLFAKFGIRDFSFFFSIASIRILFARFLNSQILPDLQYHVRSFRTISRSP